MGALLFALSFVIGLITTFAILRKISLSSNNSGIFILSKGKYLRVHHWELGAVMMIIGLVIFGLALILPIELLKSNLQILAQVFGGMGLAVFLTDFKDFIENRHWY